MSSPAPGGFRERVRPDAPLVSWINIIAGLWLIISPWVLRDPRPQAYWNDVLVGIAVVILASIRTYGPFRPVWATWLNILLGIWLIIASFVLNVPIDHANELIVGIIVVLIGLWSAQGTRWSAAPTSRAA